MKKVVSVLLLTVIIVAFSFGQESSPIRKDSFGINVLALGTGLILTAGVVIVMEYQHAFNPYLALIVMPEVIIGYGDSGVATGIGVNIYPMGRYLHGFYIGLIPVAGVLTDSSFVFGGHVRLGYEWVFNSGFLLSLGGGATWFNNTALLPELALTLGYAW